MANARPSSGVVSAVLRQLHSRGGLAAHEVETIAANFGEPTPASTLAAALHGRAVWIGTVLAPCEEVELYYAGKPDALSARAKVYLRANATRLLPSAPAVSRGEPRAIVASDCRDGSVVNGIPLGANRILPMHVLPEPTMPRHVALERWTAWRAPRGARS